MQKVLLLVNTGTPDDPGTKSVKKYLSEFLNDPEVIDLPWLARKLLVNIIIVPFRSAKSAKLYGRLWTSEGSPLRINLMNLASVLQKKLGDKYKVIGAMRYGNPSLADALKELRDSAPDELVVLPLYPQYASSTTGSVRALLNHESGKWKKKPVIRFVDQFYSHPAFISSFSAAIEEQNPDRFDHVLFSYHSLPVKHIKKIHPGIEPEDCRCTERLPDHGRLCYRATCYETTRLIAESLGLNKDKFSTSFQSRMSENWIGPFTDKVLNDLLHEGKRDILVAAPSFVSDCLETSIEIGEDYRDLFLKNGGNELVLAESLNCRNEWADAIIKIASLEVPTNPALHATPDPQGGPLLYP